MRISYLLARILKRKTLRTSLVAGHTETDTPKSKFRPFILSGHMVNKNWVKKTRLRREQLCNKESESSQPNYSNK